jgi:hypothetical protein
MARFLRFAYGATSSAVIILLLTLGTFSLYPWVRVYRYDPESILQLFALFPVIVALVAQVWPSPHRGCPPFAAGAAGVVIGLVYGYAAPRVVFARWLLSMGGYWDWRILGPNLWEIDLTVLVFAIVAGSCALLLSITARSRPVIATVAILILISVLVPVPTFDLINHNQELTVAVAIPYATSAASEPDETANVDPTAVESSRLTHHVLGLLRNEGITGQYRVSEQDRFGHGRQVLVVIVLNQPVVNKVQLPQPRGGDVIYLQQPDGWKKIPPHVPTLGRSLTLEPPDEKDWLARFSIDEVGHLRWSSAIWKTSK